MRLGESNNIGSKSYLMCCVVVLVVILVVVALTILYVPGVAETIEGALLGFLATDLLKPRRIVFSDRCVTRTADAHPEGPRVAIRVAIRLTRQVIVAYAGRVPATQR